MVSTFAELEEQCWQSFLSSLDLAEIERVHDKRPSNVWELVYEPMREAIDQHLLERSTPEQTTLLLNLCLDLPLLFTRMPQAVSCITRDDEQVTASHCVYHNAYDALVIQLEQRWDAYLEEQPEEGEGED